MLVRRDYAHRHEGGMRSLPCQSLPFVLEEAIDNNGVSFRPRPTGEARGFTIDHGRPGIDCQKMAIGKDDLAAEGNPPRIDSTMSVAQSNTGRASVLPRTPVRASAAVGPVNRYAGQHGLLARNCGWRDKSEKQDRGKDSFHMKKNQQTRRRRV
jgi:hypothetical protein